MQTKMLIFFILITLLFVFTACYREWFGDINGQITDLDTEEPINDVLIVASSEKNEYSISTRTDSDGNYRVRDVRWGPNKVVTYHPNYETQIRYADVIRDESVTLDFELDPIPDSIEPVLTIYVFNTNNDPIENARIDLYREEDPVSDEYLYISTEETDSGGAASFQLAIIYEKQIVSYQLRIVALGYKDYEYNFFVTWLEEEPELRIDLEFTR